MERNENLTQAIIGAEGDVCMLNSAAHGDQLVVMETVDQTAGSDVFVQQSTVWKSSVISALHSMQREGKLCDLTLVGHSGTPHCCAFYCAVSSFIPYKIPAWGNW